MEKEKANIVEVGRRNNGVFKTRMAAAAEERTQSAQTIAELQAKVDALQQERDALATQAAAALGTEDQAVLTSQIDTLIREKAALEKSLAEATAINVTGAAQEEVNAEIVSCSCLEDCHGDPYRYRRPA
jgi:uncharacterized protein involved in exopolysaccharide biosynthesis